jgi:hypothetical protein
MKVPLLGLLARPKPQVASRTVGDEHLSSEKIYSARLIDQDLQSVGLESVTICTKVLTESYDDE